MHGVPRAFGLLHPATPLLLSGILLLERAGPCETSYSRVSLHRVSALFSKFHSI